MSLNIKIKKMHPNAKIPSYAYNGDGCVDLFAVDKPVRVLDRNGYRLRYRTGIAVEIPEGHVGLIFPRSSISTKTGLDMSNAVGVLDQNFRGEITAVFNVLQPTGVIYEEGQAIGQLMVLPYPKLTFTEVTELSKTDRGEGGFGSSGDGKERK